MGSDGNLLGEKIKLERKKRLAALIVSLVVPGIGHFVRGRIGMAIAALVLDASFVAFAVVMNGLRPDLGWLLWPVWSVTFAFYYILTAYDAYRGPRLEEAPCKTACPAGINVPGYVALVAAGRHGDALELIRSRAPLAGVLGRICPAPCEEVCTRTRIEEPIAIRALKRAASPVTPVTQPSSPVTPVTHKLPSPPPSEKNSPSDHSTINSKRKVAVVGAGPSGLSCAHFLAQRGYKVDIFEAEPKPGGILRDIIPCFRLPGEVVQSDIDYILSSNPSITILTNRTLGKDISLDELERSYGAVYLALGASKPRPLFIEGEDLEGVIPGLTFLRNVCVGKVKSLSGHVAVLGGGNTAVDSARVALRMGAEKVTVFYRRMRANMPAYKLEIEEAEKEGIKFHFLAAPLKFSGKKHVQKIRFTHMTLSDREKGRGSALVASPGDEWDEEVKAVIVAVGQEPDIEFLNRLDLPVDVDGRLEINRHQRIKRRRIFAGGDAVRGPSTVVEASGDGLAAARSIDYFLRPRFLGSFFERLGEFDPESEIEKLPGAAWTVKNPAFKARIQEQTSYKKLELSKETLCGLKKGDDTDEARRCLACHKHNPGFAFNKGKQKGYIPIDER